MALWPPYSGIWLNPTTWFGCDTDTPCSFAANRVLCLSPTDCRAVQSSVWRNRLVSLNSERRYWASRRFLSNFDIEIVEIASKFSHERTVGYLCVVSDRRQDASQQDGADGAHTHRSDRPIERDCDPLKKPWVNCRCGLAVSVVVLRSLGAQASNGWAYKCIWSAHEVGPACDTAFVVIVNLGPSFFRLNTLFVSVAEILHSIPFQPSKRSFSWPQITDVTQTTGIANREASNKRSELSLAVNL